MQPVTTTAMRSMIRATGWLCVPALLGGGCAHQSQVQRAGSPANTETIAISVSEGTTLSLDVSSDGRTIVTDLLGQLWVIPGAGGVARPITDAVADTAEDLDPSLSPDGRRVVFTAERGGQRGLWLLELNGGTPVQLYQLPDPFSRAAEAAWSPDGRQIAFSRTDPADSGDARWISRIALLDVSTRAVRDILVQGMSDVNLQSPAWSPDGQRLAFVGRARNGNRIWTVGSNGGPATPITPVLARAMALAFAPDGQRIAYLASDSAGLLQVWVHELSGSPESTQPRRLTSHNDVASTRIRWSADGASLLYSADGKLRRMSPSGGAPSEIPFSASLSFTRPRVTLPRAQFPEPGEVQVARSFMGLALSPDAQRIGMIALGRLWIAHVGSDARAIAEVPHTARYLTWSPDGKEVAWSAGPFREQDIFATDLRSGVTRRVTALKGREILPSYSPDGRWLAFAHSDSVARLRIISARADLVSDTSATRDLGNAEVNWAGSNVSAPQWSPDSDALLQLAGWDLGQETTAELVPLASKRASLKMPDAPNFLGWTRDGLMWTRHDRLWTAPFDRTGMSGTPTALADAPAMYPSAIADGTVLFLSEGGLRLRSPSGSERVLGWPVRYTVPVPEPLVVRNVRIIDGTGAPASEPRDVLVERGRIARIAPAGSIASHGRRVLDAAGGFAIPGLMDLHAHSYVPELLPGFLYFGITLIRDQGSDMAPIAAYADAIAAGVIPGPRVSYGGFQYYSDWPFDEEQGRGIEPEADPDHVRRSVALAEAFGSHHLKTRTFRRWDINARIIQEGQRRGMRSTGHCARQLPLIAAGISTKEHIGLCSERWQAGGLRDMLQYEDVNQLFRVAGVGVVPTISYFAFAAYMNERPDMLDSDAELAPFMPARTSFNWILNLDAQGREIHARAARQARETTLRLVRAGVTIGTGTDIWQIPIGVHMEMAELVAAGLSPMDAIRAATIGSARIVGVDQDLGTIEVGKLADLVLLLADPLADIRNTRRITAVVKSGAVVDRASIADNHRVRWENPD